MSKWKVYQDGCDYYYDDKTDWFVHWVTVKGKTFAIPMKSEQAARAVGNYVNHFGKYKTPTFSTPEVIQQYMFDEYCRCLLHLRAYGREMRDYDEERIEDGPPLVHDEKGINGVAELSQQGKANSYRDLLEYENGPIRQRRFYGPDGYVEQDFDFTHTNRHGNHVFPHCHLWFKIKGKMRKSLAIPFSRPNKKATQYNKELYMEDSYWDETEQWLEEHNITPEYVDQLDSPERKKSPTILDLQVRLALGWDFEAFCGDKNAKGFFYPFYGGRFCIEAEYEGKDYYYETDDLDDFGENAMFGPFPLKEIVGELNL